MNMDGITSIKGCVEFLRSLPDCMEGHDEDNGLVVFYPRKMADALEVASRRDDDDENETLVKNCATCQHWSRTYLCGKRSKGGLCVARDSLTTEEFGGNCRQWECKYGRKNGGRK